MQVVSGAIGKEKVHYEAVKSELVKQEMDKFLDWFNKAEAQVHVKGLIVLDLIPVLLLLLQAVLFFKEKKKIKGLFFFQKKKTKIQTGNCRIFAAQLRQLFDVTCPHADFGRTYRA